MKKIKVLHISETFAAGVYTYIKDICEFFDKESEFENYVIYSGKREDTKRDGFETDFSKDTTLIEIEMERKISPIRDFKGVWSIAKKINEIKPDVIHLHSSKASILGRVSAAFYRKAKLFYTPNGYSFVRQDISSTKRGLYKFVEHNIIRFFGGVTIACGDTEYEHAKELGPALLVRNGTDVGKIQKFIREKKTSDFTIGTIGRMSPQKNPKLFNDIALSFPNVNFIWIGDGELRHLVSANNIIIKGWVPREKVLDIVNDFDIYIQTSLWEGLPFTIIEAMLLKKPVIATNVIGNKDAVKNSYNGFVCDSLVDFISSINILINNEKLLIQQGENSEIRAKELFNRDENFKKLVHIYKNSID